MEAMPRNDHGEKQGRGGAMLTQEELQDLIGATAYDQSGQKIGTVSSIYWDKATQMPEWAAVKTGLFGVKETFTGDWPGEGGQQSN